MAADEREKCRANLEKKINDVIKVSPPVVSLTE